MAGDRFFERRRLAYGTYVMAEDGRITITITMPGGQQAHLKRGSGGCLVGISDAGMTAEAAKDGVDVDEMDAPEIGSRPSCHPTWGHTHCAHSERCAGCLAALDGCQMRSHLRYGVVEDSGPAVPVGKKLGKGIASRVVAVFSSMEFRAGSARRAKKSAFTSTMASTSRMNSCGYR